MRFRAIEAAAAAPNFRQPTYNTWLACNKSPRASDAVGGVEAPVSQPIHGLTKLILVRITYANASAFISWMSTAGARPGKRSRWKWLLFWAPLVAPVRTEPLLAYALHFSLSRRMSAWARCPCCCCCCCCHCCCRCCRRLCRRLCDCCCLRETASDRELLVLSRCCTRCPFVY